jgi:hypothetical protein
MPTIDTQLRERIAAFAAELTELVRASALDLVREALANGAAPARGRRRSRAEATGTRRTAARGKGRKRDPAEIARLTDRLGGFVARNPGKRIEEIARELGTSTKELVLPVRKLIEGKRLTTKGERRATKYFSA